MSMGFNVGVEISGNKIEFCLNGESYLSIDIKGNDVDRFYKAFAEGISKIENKNIDAICFASENSTYIFDEDKEIEGDSAAGSKDIKEVISAFDQNTFIEEIGMNHPFDNSFPLPRMLYIRKYFGNDKKMNKIKDHIIEKLTGYQISDPFTWVGLSSPKDCSYSEILIEKFGLSVLLPTLKSPLHICPQMKGEVAKDLGLANKPMIINGCDSFTASLIALGLDDDNVVDIMGEIETLSIKSKKINAYSRPYIDGNVISGRHLSYSSNERRGSGLGDNNFYDLLKQNPPICLPYWNGVEFPKPYPNSYGSYIGGDIHDKKALSYSSTEGNVFASFDIYSNLSSKKKCVVSNKKDKVAGLLKASLFGLPVIVRDNHPSFGAYVLSYSVTNGIMIEEAQRKLIEDKEIIWPDEKIREKLLERFAKFKELVDKYEYGSHF